jgi:hypothetical protein
MLSFLKEENGQYSGRRVSALICLLASITMGIFAVIRNPSTWYAYIPCIVFLVAMLFLYFFTTWGDIASAAAIVRFGKKDGV